MCCNVIKCVHYLFYVFGMRLLYQLDMTLIVLTGVYSTLLCLLLSHEAHPSRGNKRRRDEKQISTPQTPHEITDVQTKKYCNRRTALEWSVGKLLVGGRSRVGGGKRD